MNLGRLINLGHPARHATYELQEIGTPTLDSLLRPYVAKWTVGR